LKGKCHDWTKNDDGIGNRLAGQLTACDGLAAAAVVVVVVDTGAVAASAQVPWVASAEVMLVALAEDTWLASAEIAWRTWAEITMVMEDVVTAAITTTAAVRITHRTTGPTPAPIEL
jgi:hypothetical protein